MAAEFQEIVWPGGFEFLQRPVHRPHAKQARLQLIEHLEARIHAGLNGVLAQQAGAKGVDCADARAFQRLAKVPAARLLEGCRQPVFHLGRRVFREGDGQNAAELHFSAEHAAPHTLHQHARLAGTWPGRDTDQRRLTLDRLDLFTGKISSACHIRCVNRLPPAPPPLLPGDPPGRDQKTRIGNNRPRAPRARRSPRPGWRPHVSESTRGPC